LRRGKGVALRSLAEVSLLWCFICGNGLLFLQRTLREEKSPGNISTKKRGKERGEAERCLYRELKRQKRLTYKRKGEREGFTEGVKGAKV